MNATDFFGAHAIGAILVGLVAVAHMAKELVVWALRNWPASKGKVE